MIARKLIFVGVFACPLLFLSTASVYAGQCLGDARVGSDVYGEYDRYCTCAVGDYAYAYDFSTDNEWYVINGWKISTSSYSYLNCWRESNNQIGSAARIPQLPRVQNFSDSTLNVPAHVNVQHWLSTETSVCPNTIGFKHEIWYCTPIIQGSGDESNAAPAPAATYAVDGGPDHIWEIEAPVESATTQDVWEHTFRIKNREQSQAFYVNELKFFDSRTKHTDLVALDWASVPNVLGSPQQVAAVGGELTHDVYTIGDNLGKYIYFKLVVTTDGNPVNRLFTARVRHAAFDTSIPAVSEWGLVVMLLLVVAAGTIVIRRRRAAVA